MKGKVNWFNIKKGYGFITPEDGSKDVFVHFSGIASDQKFKQLNKGQLVEFQITENDKGRTAIEVSVVENQNPTLESSEPTEK